MFHKLCLSISCLLIAVSPLSAQDDSPAPEIATRYEIGGSGLDSMMEYSAQILEHFKSTPSGILVVRLCSEKPLPVAIATAAIEPLTLARYLARYSIPEEKIVVSRSASCQGKLATNTATELWLARAESHVPQALESIKACQIQIQEIKSGSDAQRKIMIGTYDYVPAVKRLIVELKADPHATGTVLGYYLQHPPRAIRKKLERARRLLQKSGLPVNRYAVQPLYWTGWPEVEEQLGHLSVGIVRITPGCRSLSRESDVIWLK
jgi:hypothetical protein